MAVMMGGMVLAGIMVIRMLPAEIGLSDAVHIAGKMDKMNIISTEFDFKDRYNIWSGMTAAVFLFMSYFGTDQSQVQRYLTGSSLKESRLGLMMNGLLKVPMQFVILFIGVMVFVFYQFERPPIFFNEQVKTEVTELVGAEFIQIEGAYDALHDEKKDAIYSMVDALHEEDLKGVERHQTKVNRLQAKSEDLRDKAKEIISGTLPDAETNDKDYIFMSFVMDYLPVGMIGLLFAVMFSAAMSSTASELNALASTTTIDLYKRSVKQDGDDRHYVGRSKLFTFMWGIIAILFATYASLFENLIQAVNLLGSLFYGTILGIFLVAFYFKRIGGHAVFIAALIAEVLVVYLHYINATETAPEWLTMGFLWYNLVGCLLVVVIGYVLQLFIGEKGSVTD